MINNQPTLSPLGAFATQLACLSSAVDALEAGDTTPMGAVGKPAKLKTPKEAPVQDVENTLDKIMARVTATIDAELGTAPAVSTPVELVFPEGTKEELAARLHAARKELKEQPDVQRAGIRQVRETVAARTAVLHAEIKFLLTGVREAVGTAVVDVREEKRALKAAAREEKAKAQEEKIAARTARRAAAKAIVDARLEKSAKRREAAALKKQTALNGAKARTAAALAREAAAEKALELLTAEKPRKLVRIPKNVAATMVDSTAATV